MLSLEYHMSRFRTPISEYELIPVTPCLHKALAKDQNLLIACKVFYEGSSIYY